MSEHVTPLRHYLLIFAALLILTGVTVQAAYLDLGAFNSAVALSIACIKGLLVVLWFMHLRHSSRLTWVFAGASVLWLIFLIGITFTDYLSRGWHELEASRFPPAP
jgi:cytochrome c oxidase subunit 4